MILNFTPHPGKTVNGAVTAGSTDIALTEQPIGTTAMRLTNSGSQTIFWKYGSGGASLTTSTPMLPNTVEIFDLPFTTGTLAVIAAAVGSTLYVTPGIGS